MRARDMLWIERRATRIANALLIDGIFLVEGRECAGWMRAGDNREPRLKPPDRRWHAGYIAACIWYEMQSAAKSYSGARVRVKT